MGSIGMRLWSGIPTHDGRLSFSRSQSETCSGSHRLGDDFHQVAGQRGEIDLLAERRAEGFEGLARVILAAVEAAVDKALEATAQGLKQRGDEQCRDDDQHG